LYVKILEINSADEVFDVNIQNDLKITYHEVIDVHVKFTEALTRKVIETTTENINIVPYIYELEFIGSDNLVPNQPYKFKVSLRRIDTGEPVSQT
jgi:hypothetical protein